MARCSNCGEENPGWVPVEELTGIQATVRQLKGALVTVVETAHRVLDIFDEPRPPEPSGDVRPFRRKRRGDGGVHRGPRQ